jgi:hypothetical protein
MLIHYKLRFDFDHKGSNFSLIKNKFIHQPQFMKKILCVAMLLTSISTAFAQLYVRGNIGYNLPANGQAMGSDSRQVYNSQTGVTKRSDEVVNGSYGSGLSFHAGVGASINGTLGYDVELGYLVGKKYSTQYYYSTGSYVDQSENETSSSSFQIAPSLTFTAGAGSFQPYTRVGPVIAISKLKSEESASNTYTGINETQEYEYTGGVSLGFKGVLGVLLNTDKKLQFFGELSFVSMSYAPKERELTAYTVNGDDALSSVPKEQRTIDLKDKITQDDTNSELREKYSLGSLGVQVGARFMLK